MFSEQVITLESFGFLQNINALGTLNTPHLDGFSNVLLKLEINAYPSAWCPSYHAFLEPFPVLLMKRVHGFEFYIFKISLRSFVIRESFSTKVNIYKSS